MFLSIKIDRTDQIETIATIEAIETIETIEAIEAIEAIETIETIATITSYSYYKKSHFSKNKKKRPIEIQSVAFGTPNPRNVEHLDRLQKGSQIH